MQTFNLAITGIRKAAISSNVGWDAFVGGATASNQSGASHFGKKPELELSEGRDERQSETSSSSNALFLTSEEAQRLQACA